MRVLSSLALCSILMMPGCGGGGAGSASSCSTLNAKIYGGDVCNQNARTAVVELVVQFADGFATTCTGSLITLDDILTSAHCFYHDGIAPVVAGARVGGANGQIIEIVDYDLHPSYNGSTGNRFDVGMATLKSLPNPLIAPLPILLSEITTPGSKITAFGYGKNESGTNHTLKAASFKINSIEDGNLMVIGDGNSSICVGDSGGPAIYVTSAGVSTLAGINSFGSANSCINTAAQEFGFVDVQDESILNFIADYAPDASIY